MLKAAAAAALDAELMPALYSLEQLMEVAGYSVALAVADCFPPSTFPNVLVLCGPGNNGGDGLVSARHLASLGYTPTVLCPKPSPSAHYARLLAQLGALGIPCHAALASEGCPPLSSFHCAVDAVLGFSSTLPLREPFAGLIAQLAAQGTPTLAVDVPTGWDPDAAAGAQQPAPALQPRALLSLTAPKPCASAFMEGAAGRRHYLALSGLIPAALRLRYSLEAKAPVPTPGLGGLVRLA
jgi:NAD(P)H-hydrate epimerase